jgi:hypothetical protein
MIFTNIQTLYSVLCWSTFGSDYSLESSWVWRYKLGTPVFGEFLPFFSADPLKFCQIGWGASLQFFQVSPEMFDRSGLWLGHSWTFRDLSRIQSCIVLAVCLGSLSCWKVNLWSRFSSTISVLCSVHLSQDPDSGQIVQSRYHQIREYCFSYPSPRSVFLSKSCPINWIYHRTPNKL